MLRIVGEIAIDYFQKSTALRRESNVLIPRITADAIEQILPSLEQTINQPNPVTAFRAVEAGVNPLILSFARHLEEYGYNFRAGAGFACLVFRKLNEAGFNFTPVSEAVIGSYDGIYREALHKFPEISQTSAESAETQKNFLKGILLFGFLELKLYSEENPELMKLFEAFSSNRPFAKEGCILIYELKTLQFLKSKSP